MLVDVLRWARQAEIGERIVYAERTSRDQERADRVTAQSMFTAHQAHEAGLVFLAQRRMKLKPVLTSEPADAFAYEATRISARTAKKLGLRVPEVQPL